MDVDKVDNMASVLLEKESKNTERSTRQSVKAFYDYLAKKNLSEPPSDKGGLCGLLKSFYQDVRKTDGSHYTKNSLQSLRYGLCRHFRSIREIDIITDVAFTEANKSYQARCIFLKDQGLDKVDHKPLLLEDDLIKLYQSGVFDTRYPRTLQNKVFFEIILFFCRRYGQNPKDLKSSDFEFRVDNQGRRYVCKTGYNMPTNRQESEDGLDIMYEKGGPYCPVASLELYLKHLNPSNPSLFQKAKKDHLLIDESWYENVSLGERVLAEKMKGISEEAQLSKVFSNHSIRMISISMLNMCIFGSICPWIVRVRGRIPEAASESPTQSVCKKRKISETRVDTDQSVTHDQALDVDSSEWAEYRTRSGQVLLIKIMEKSNSSSKKGLPNESSTQAKNLVSIGTQTDDTECINGCTSKYVPLLCCGNDRPFTQANKTAYKQDNSAKMSLEDGNGDKDAGGVRDRHDTSYASDLSAVLRVLDEDESDTSFGMGVPTQHTNQSQNEKNLVCEKNKNVAEMNHDVRYGMIVPSQLGNPSQNQESFVHKNQDGFVCEKSENVYSNHEENTLHLDDKGHCIEPVWPNSKGEHLRVGNPANLASTVVSQYLYKLTHNITTVRTSTKPPRPRNTPIKILPKSLVNTSSVPVGTAGFINQGNTAVDISNLHVVNVSSNQIVAKPLVDTLGSSVGTAYSRYISPGDTPVDTSQLVNPPGTPKSPTGPNHT
ncbi:uncharacterized protein LOC110239398 [Exaiptasia diaphana]|uniref:DUF3504 domain-containing protein n=1 Tax=Exaiptasia diaphana TaxID=2652724 RepID=A0A913X8Y8_EXADI|nr:uncharacterized protein LOC110239398 [Exaiptasia diaphana]KXJ14039.1 Uncharacterized protein KIAA1958 [Exaiptasia diaphana]